MAKNALPRPASTHIQAQPPATPRRLTAEEFHRLADMPHEAQWFANITNANTRRAYQQALQDFMAFTGIIRPDEFRIVTRAHVIAWRDRLIASGLSGASIRNRLSALSSLFASLCESNAVAHNPCIGVKRPKTGHGDRTSAISSVQARQLLDAPSPDTLQGKRDRAILATLLFHALRRDELCKLTLKDVRHIRQGVPHLRVSGKGGKIRHVPLHPEARQRISEYIAAAGHEAQTGDSVFRPMRTTRSQPGLSQGITPDAVYKIVQAYSAELGFATGAHALRATAATNALENGADLAAVQEWLGHASITTTRIYDHRISGPERSPTTRVDFRND